MNRLRQKNDLLVKLGILFGPILKFEENPAPYDEQERAEICARFCSEYPRLVEEFRAFSVGQPGHNFVVQLEKFAWAMDITVKSLTYVGRPDWPGTLTRGLSEAQAAIDAIPVPRGSVILEAYSPFSTYCLLKDLCEAEATSGLIWIDAYMAGNIFHRFLRCVRPQVSVTLVTSERGPNAGRRDRDRWAEFLDISRLFSQERNSTRYRLVVNPNLHDRWLLLDGRRLYGLGGSAKDAGDRQYFTISRIDATPENLGAIQAHIDSGVEYYGPNTPQHR